MFKRILIANRGEIAIRVIRACRDLGISPIAVYSEADRTALHVALADEAFYIGPSPARESYLVGSRLIEVAHQAGAEAIHPGYGFLSENAAFAEACTQAGIAFIGPPPEAMRLMGDKIAARRTMIAAGVPVVQGTDLLTDPAAALKAAREIGLPVLIKAAAGGGGKGIRVVQTDADLEQAFSIAASEAQSAFGDSGVYIEKLLAPVRHIEVQVMADNFGNTVAVGERECSIQRRNQKLIEESPSVVVAPEIREQLFSAAVSAARAAGYRNAGTVEFLMDRDGKFYFLEVNARLQVEHPVTELVTGFDLAVDQIRIAAGLPLPYTQGDVLLRGHALECRITAEDPANQFAPSVGRITAFRPPSGPGVRWDSDVYSGGEVSIYYDPMIGKLIVWGADRNQAIARMRRALHELLIAGIQTNILFHLQMLDDDRFLRGDLHTRLLDEEFTYLGAPSDKDLETASILAALVSQVGSTPNDGQTQNHHVSSRWRAAGRQAEQRNWSNGWR